MRDFLAVIIFLASLSIGYSQDVTFIKKDFFLFTEPLPTTGKPLKLDDLEIEHGGYLSCRIYFYIDSLNDNIIEVIGFTIEDLHIRNDIGELENKNELITKLNQYQILEYIEDITMEFSDRITGHYQAILTFRINE